MDSVIELLEIEFRVGTYFLHAFSGPLQGLKIRGGHSTEMGIMCFPVKTGLTDLPKLEAPLLPYPIAIALILCSMFHSYRKPGL